MVTNQSKMKKHIHIHIHTYTLETQANIINYDFLLLFFPILSVYFRCIISARLITASPVGGRRLHNKDEACLL